MQLAEATYQLDSLDRGQIDRAIRNFWKERLANGERAIRKYCAEDVEFRLLSGPPSLPGPRLFRGIDAVVEAIRVIDTNLEVLSFQINDLIIDGDQAALRWYGNFRNRGTGVEGDLAVFDLITLRNGQIVGYAQYLDTQGLDDLMAGDAQHLLARISNRKQILVNTGPQQVRADLDAVDIEERNRREQFLRDFWEARVRTGSAACRDYFADDVELHLIGDPVAIPFARVHIGLEETCALVERIDLEFEIQAFEIRTVLIDGDRAALQWCADVRHRGTNAPGHIEGFDQMLFENGRLKLITKFFDTAQVARCITG